MSRLLTMTVAVLITTAGFASLGAAAETDVRNREEPFEKAMEAPAEDSMETPGNFGQDLDNPRAREDSPRGVHSRMGAEPSPGNIRGVVTLVGDDMIRLVELDTGIAHEIKVTDAQEKALTTGYAISAELRDGRLVSYRELGVPPDVQDIVYSAENLPTDNVLEGYYRNKNAID